MSNVHILLISPTNIHNTLFLNRRDGKPGSLFWFTFPYRSDDMALIDAPRMPRMPTSTSRTVLNFLLPNFASSMSISTKSSPLPSPFPTPRNLVSLSPLVEGQGQVPRKFLSSKKILLVDDTPSIIKMVGRLLKVTPPSPPPNPIIPPPFLPPPPNPSLPPPPTPFIPPPPPSL